MYRFEFTSKVTIVRTLNAWLSIWEQINIHIDDNQTPRFHHTPRSINSVIKYISTGLKINSVKFGLHISNM